MRELHASLPIRSARLRIRHFERADAADLHAYKSSPAVARYLYWEPMSCDACVELAERRSRARSLATEEAVIFACELPEPRKVIGDVMLRWVNRGAIQREIGFVFHPGFHGRGYATEAGREILRLGFESCGMHRIVGRRDARNGPSGEGHTAARDAPGGHLIEDEMFTGGWSTTLVYAMLECEWRDSFGISAP